MMPNFIDAHNMYVNDCERGNAHEFNSFVADRNIDLKCFGVFHLNIRSINSNFNLLIAYLNSLNFKFPIIVLTETWLCDNDIGSYNLDNYSSFNIKANGRSGGVCVFVHDSFSAHQVNIVHGNSFQSVNLNIKIPYFGEIFLAAIYRSPSNSKFMFNNDFQNTYSNVFNNNTKLLFVGDFNMNLFLDHDVQVNRFANFFYSLNLIPLITVPTRVQDDADGGTLIDNIWSNVPHRSETFVFNCGITDHYPIASIFPFLMGSDLIKIRFRDFSETNLAAFTSDFELLRGSFINNFPDLHSAHTGLELWLSSTLDHYFPIHEKSVGLKRLNAPWLTKSLLKCIDKKHKMYRLFKNGFISRTYFNVYKNKLKSVINYAKAAYFDRRFYNAKNSIKKTWGIINKSLNRKKTCKISDLKVNNRDVTDVGEICEVLNSHFVSVANNLHSQLSILDDNDDDLLNIIPFNSSSIVMLDTDPMEVSAAITDLKNNANIKMPTKFIKLFDEILSPILCDLFNECLQSGIFPNPLKKASITPIFKAGKRSDPNNYRPISVLSDLSKIYETLILTRLDSFLSAKSILSFNQYGFRNNRSTQEACIDLLNVLYNAFTDKTFAISLFIDFSKAFDCVDHKRLLDKLHRYGIRGNAHALIKSYLSDRTQSVKMLERSSANLSVHCGIPQGSKLGPILFNIFVNDISNIPMSCANPFQFADDTAFAAHGHDLHLLLNNFNVDMALFYRWCIKNKLSLNYNKTKAIIFTTKHLNDSIPNIVINENIIEYVSDYNYLGLTIDSGLTFKNHAALLNSRLHRLVGVTYTLKYVLSLHAAKIFYSSMVLSVLSYTIVIWGGTSQEYISNLQISQNKIIRNLFSNKMPDANTNEIYQRLEILKVSNIYKLELGKLMFNALYRERYSKLKTEIAALGWTHNFNTRKINILRLPRARINVDKGRALFAATSFWNTLPLYIRSKRSVPSFGRALKSYLLSQQMPT